MLIGILCIGGLILFGLIIVNIKVHLQRKIDERETEKEVERMMKLMELQSKLREDSKETDAVAHNSDMMLHHRRIKFNEEMDIK